RPRRLRPRAVGLRGSARLHEAIIPSRVRSLAHHEIGKPLYGGARAPMSWTVESDSSNATWRERMLGRNRSHGRVFAALAVALLGAALAGAEARAQSGVWTTGPTLPEALEYFAAASIGTTVYTAGGYDTDLAVAQRRLFTLDTTATGDDAKWLEGPSM